MTTATIATTVTGLQGRPLATTAPTANQLIGWNGTTWTPQGPFLPTAGGSVTGNVTVSGSVTGGSVQTNGTPGTFLNGSGVNILTGRGYNGKGFLSSQFAFSGSTQVAAGANLTMTPHVTSLVLFCGMCQLGAGSSNSAVNMGLCFGTGTPPAQGGGITGTLMAYGSTFGTNANIYGAWVPWGIMLPWGGFTVGTQYWFDFACAVSNNVGTGYAMWGDIYACEM